MSVKITKYTFFGSKLFHISAIPIERAGSVVDETVRQCNQSLRVQSHHPATAIGARGLTNDFEQLGFFSCLMTQFYSTLEYKL